MARELLNVNETNTVKEGDDTQLSSFQLMTIMSQPFLKLVILGRLRLARKTYRFRQFLLS